MRHFNYRWQRTRALLEDRFKSCLVQDAEYLLLCYRYIEFDPVRAPMVYEPEAYRWSSYRAGYSGAA